MKTVTFVINKCSKLQLLVLVLTPKIYYYISKYMYYSLFIGNFFVCVIPGNFLS